MWLHVGDAPAELLLFKLCTELYHCTPSQIKQERLVDVLPHVTISNVATDVQEAELRSAQLRTGRR